MGDLCLLETSLLFSHICTVPYAIAGQPLLAPALLDEMVYQASRGSTGPATTASFGSHGFAADVWGSGGVLAPNGKIYAVPNDQNNVNNVVLAFTPETRTHTTFAGPGAANFKWGGGVLAPDGLIYAPPVVNATSFLVINPATNSHSTFGSLTAGYGSAILAPNGYIYALPLTVGRSILKLDPVNRTFSTFGPTTGGYRNGSLGRNGRIYAWPDGLATVAFLEIDPATDSATTFGPAAAGNGWIGGVMAPDGNIYAAPRAITGLSCSTLLQRL